MVEIVWIVLYFEIVSEELLPAKKKKRTFTITICINRYLKKKSIEYQIFLTPYGKIFSEAAGVDVSTLKYENYSF